MITQDRHKGNGAHHGGALLHFIAVVIGEKVCQIFAEKTALVGDISRNYHQVGVFLLAGFRYLPLSFRTGAAITKDGNPGACSFARMLAAVGFLAPGFRFPRF